MMDNTRKTALLEKLAARPKSPKWKFEPGRIGAGIAEDAAKKMLGGVTGGIGGGIGDVIKDNIVHKFGRKPTMMQMLTAKGGVGRKALALGGLAAAFGGGVAGAEKGVDHITKKFSRESGFRNMIKENPHLKKEPHNDVRRIFNTLHRFSPKMAKDPLVAGSFLKRSLMFKDEGIQPQDIKTLAEVSKNMAQSGPKSTILQSAFGPALSGAFGD